MAKWSMKLLTSEGSQYTSFSLAPLRVFRVLKLQPRATKKGRTLVETLRSDHVCIRFYDVEALGTEERKFNVHSAFHDCPSQVNVFSMTELLRICSLLLATQFMRCQMANGSVF